MGRSQPPCARFARLPCWVRVVLTGRPQVEKSFAGWATEWIKPGDAQNQEDMRLLLTARLQQGGYVQPGDVEAAAMLLLGKSKAGTGCRGV